MPIVLALAALTAGAFAILNRKHESAGTLPSNPILGQQVHLYGPEGEPRGVVEWNGMNWVVVSRG